MFRPELGHGGRSIVVLRSNTGDTRDSKLFDPGGKTTDDQESNVLLRVELRRYPQAAQTESMFRPIVLKILKA
jgi:hypothetical protein